MTDIIDVNLTDTDEPEAEEITVEDELDVLVPPPETATLSTGLVVRYEPLLTKQFFLLLRIITNGAGPALLDPTFLRAKDKEGAEAWGQKLMALIIVAVPDAAEETLAFVRAMVKPDGLVEPQSRRDKLKLSEEDKAHNRALWEQLIDDLDNPPLEDTFEVIEGVVRREAKNLSALGKRIAGMLRAAQLAGKLPASATPPKQSTANSSEPSAERST